MSKSMRILCAITVAFVIGGAALHFVPVPASMSEFSHFIIGEQLRRSSQACEKVTGVYIRKFWSESQIFEIYCQDGHRYTKELGDNQTPARRYAAK